MSNPAAMAAHDPSDEASILVIGWEVVMTTPDLRTNKFYRVFLSGDDVVINYGRRHKKGQVQRHSCDSFAAAAAKARKLATEKQAKGYVPSLPVTPFQVSQRDFQRADSDPSSAQRVIDAFLDHAANAHSAPS
ncbi:hypothetical protein GCM10009733_020890 [Nonomuraea maheshkhaliensis]|uniref:WGR domain-containing protein n=1 Tax=Nonomuraea maheshkhaliensis TaxID=419590 RepID=A0ABP4QZX9_9ACTN